MNWPSQKKSAPRLCVPRLCVPFLRVSRLRVSRLRVPTPACHACVSRLRVSPLRVLRCGLQTAGVNQVNVQRAVLQVNGGRALFRS